MQKQRLEAMDIWFAYFNKEIGLHQLNRIMPIRLTPTDTFASVSFIGAAAF